MEFEWDPAKERANIAKHRLDIITFKLDPDHPPATDWSGFDAMMEEEREAAARADPDSPPLTQEHLARARRVSPIKALRFKLDLTQEEFAARFHLPLGTVRDWERGARRPDAAARVLLRVIDRNPQAVLQALEDGA
ncbi:MAG TPA: helix-turn-helix domain-containing protein [Ardenticatenaceae bacterium]|nr:helix-turn-helix domain-containing protein [Ardenticatenaceae bacterium]